MPKNWEGRFLLGGRLLFRLARPTLGLSSFGYNPPSNCGSSGQQTQRKPMLRNKISAKQAPPLLLLPPPFSFISCACCGSCLRRGRFRWTPTLLSLPRQNFSPKAFRRWCSTWGCESSASRSCTASSSKGRTYHSHMISHILVCCFCQPEKHIQERLAIEVDFFHSSFSI